MKKSFLVCVLCVFFLLSVIQVGTVYAYSPEQITFSFQNRIFTYTLNENFKTPTLFYDKTEIEKFNRFGTVQERQELLTKMLNIRIDAEIALDYLFPNLINKLNTIEKNINKQAKSATFKVDSNSQTVFHITPETTGIQLDRIKLVDNICNAYLNNKPLEFAIPIKTVKPDIIKKDLEKFTHLRASFSTNISSSSTDRKHNIKNALSTLNKVVIEPNQIFSFNKIVGRRTAENGYREAKIIVNNEFVDGLGGGVCQVSSTLYNAALLAGLEIVEANKHSKQVSYVEQGFDAMVNFGSSDLKFKNNTSERITIITNFSTTYAQIKIFGEQPTNNYKLTNEVFNISPYEEEIFYDEKAEYLNKVKYDDEYFYLKRGNDGKEIKTYRETYFNNQLIHKELLRHDKYKVQNSIKVFGNKKRTENCA